MKRRLAIALALSVALHLGLLAVVRVAGARLEGTGAAAEPVAFELVEPARPEREAERAGPPERELVARRRVARRRASAPEPRLLAPAPRAEPAAPAPVAEPPALSAVPEGPAVAEEAGPDESGLAVAMGGQAAGEPSAPSGSSGGSEGGGAGLGAGGGGGGAPSSESGGAGGSGSVLMEITRLLAAQANGCYPRAAQRFHLQGTAKVRFCVTGSGAPRETRVIESSGSPLLDEGALCVVARAAPFPLTSGCLSVPIDFVMDR